MWTLKIVFQIILNYNDKKTKATYSYTDLFDIAHYRKLLISYCLCYSWKFSKNKITAPLKVYISSDRDTIFLRLDLSRKL